MKKLLLVPMAAGGLFLASAAPPEMDSVVAADATAYPPCSATVRDRCIQRRGSEERAERRQAASAAPQTAPAAQASNAYPPCSATVTDRCQQMRGQRSHYYASSRRRTQLALRMGERG